jgi:hypothetical protein
VHKIFLSSPISVYTTLSLFFTSFLQSTYCRSQWPRGLRRVDLRPLAYWDCGFESRRGHRCLSLVNVVCCQVSASGWSLVQRSPTECGVSVCDREASIMRRPWPTGGCWAILKFLYFAIATFVFPHLQATLRVSYLAIFIMYVCDKLLMQYALWIFTRPALLVHRLLKSQPIRSFKWSLSCCSTFHKLLHFKVSCFSSNRPKINLQTALALLPI